MQMYQCCYTNLLRYDGPYKVGGWTATAFSRDIPPEVLRDCEHFQRADTSDRATDEFGKTLRLYEVLCHGNYAYVIRTRYGMRDHMGRGNNLFSHAYILPMEGGFLEHPEVLFRLDRSCFTQEAGPDVEPEAESAELARQALSRLEEGRLREPPPGEPLDFSRAMDSTGLSVQRDLYKTLLQCVYAHMDAKRESGRQAPPLYVQYGAPDMDPDRKDRLLRELLCCIFYGLPYWMRRELRASNWSDIDNVPKDLIFTTEDVTRLAGDTGAYLVLSTGVRNAERRRMARLERSGYLPYAATRLDLEQFPGFFAGLDRYAKALGDPEAASEAVRKLVWQCYWDPETFRFADRPDVDRLDRKELVSLLSDAAESGLYSMGLKEVLNAVKKKIRFDTLTESLQGNLARWENEYRRRQGIPEQVTEPVRETSLPVAEAAPEADSVNASLLPEADREPVNTTLLPATDWDAVERDWRDLSGEEREALLEWLGQLLDKAQNVPIAEGLFRKRLERQSRPLRDLHFLLMIDRKVSGKLNPQSIVRAYCHEELSRTRQKADAVRWRTLSELGSICERMKAADLSERLRAEAWELFRREAKPGEPEGRAVTALRMYDELIARLCPPGGAESLSRAARESYWEQTDGNWKYFSFRALPEYDAFADGKRHMFPTLIRMADSFRPGKEKEFLKQVSRFFQTLETPAYYTSENKLRITGQLYEELDSRYAGTLPDDYRGWMNLATLAEEKGTLPAIQELYEAMRPFDRWKLTECYPRFIWKCKDGGDRKARVAAYPLVRDACFTWDARQPLPLDLWITVGLEAFSFCEVYNCFAIFEKKPDAAVLRMDPAEATRDSSLISSPAVRDYAQAYVKYRGDPQIRKAVLNWLNADSGGRKKFLGVL